jgi:hypothetical protein
MIIVIGMSKTIINMNIQKPTTTNLLKLRFIGAILTHISTLRNEKAQPTETDCAVENPP